MILVKGENLTGFRVDFEFVFPISLVEFDVILGDPVIDFILHTKTGDLIGGKTRIIQGNLYSLLLSQ